MLVYNMETERVKISKKQQINRNRESPGGECLSHTQKENMKHSIFRLTDFRVQRRPWQTCCSATYRREHVENTARD